MSSRPREITCCRNCETVSGKSDCFEASLGQPLLRCRRIAEIATRDYRVFDKKKILSTEFCQAPLDAPGELAAPGIAYHAHDPVESQIFKRPKLNRIVARLESCPFTRHAKMPFDFDVRSFAS